MEESQSASKGNGWIPQHLVLRSASSEEILAVAPAYAKTNSLGEFVFDTQFAEFCHYATENTYYPKLLLGIPFTPATGRRILTRDDESRELYLKLVAKVIMEVCESMNYSSAHINFCEEDEVTVFTKCGYFHRIGLQHHWRNSNDSPYDDFDSFLKSRFPSKKRIKLKRERTKVREHGVDLSVLSANTLTAADIVDVGYKVYVAGIEKQWLYGRQYLNRSFFTLLAECSEFVKNNVVLVAARDEADGTLIAGTFNVVGGKDPESGLPIFYGRYWGSPREMSGAPPIRGLHFETCFYQSIEYAIKNGIGRIEPGAGGGESKGPRGFDATSTSSLHFFVDPQLRRAIGSYIESEKKYVLDEIAAAAKGS